MTTQRKSKMADAEKYRFSEGNLIPYAVKCPQCLEYHLVADYPKDKAGRYGLASMCLTCRRSYARDRYKQDDGKASHARHVQDTYGLNPQQYTTLLQKQEGACAICRKHTTGNRRMHVDHCHA